MNKLDFLTIIFFPAILVIACSLLIKFSIKKLDNSKLIDNPTKRSNHHKPTLKGAGLIVIPMVIFSTTLVFFLNHIITAQWVIFFSITLILMIVSFLDDIYNISSIIRLVIHTVCVVTSIYFLTLDHEFSHALSNKFFFLGIHDEVFKLIFIILATLMWIWIINLFNFMDGMDGITAIQICFFMFGLNILTLFEVEIYELQIISLYSFSIFLGFFLYNKPPAKIFLGDSGSIPIGYLVGLILIKSALNFDIFIPLLILCMYYLLDSTLTLILRMAKNENVFQAHTSHFYQKMLRAGFSHTFVLKKIIYIHFILLICSIFSVKFPIISLVLSVCATALTLFYFSNKNITNEQ